MASKIQIQVSKLHADAQIPKYATEGSAGCDLHAIQGMVLMPGEHKIVNTGLGVAIPDGYEIQIRPRSGLAAKHGITVLNTPGTIDSDYRNAIGVILYNASDRLFEIQKGDRIAQAVLVPVYQAEFVEVDKLPETNRGLGGFGSTGVK